MGDPDADHEDEEGRDEVGPDEGDKSGTSYDYRFDGSDMSIATDIVDTALAVVPGGYGAGRAALREAETRGLDPDSPLVRLLVATVSYELRLGSDGRPSCDLAEGIGWPEPVENVSDDAVKSWAELAKTVTVPASIARLEDLLFLRSEGEALDHVTRAVDNYIAAVGGLEVGMHTAEMLVRAWHLSRVAKQAEIEKRVRQEMSNFLDALLASTPAGHAGVVIPILTALAEGPRDRSTDPVDVDGHLERAAEGFRKGYLASEIAKLRRSRTRDKKQIETINRQEAAAYFDEARNSPHAAVRMHHLEAAGRVAKTRGLADLSRRAAVEMQAIDPKALNLIKFSESSSIPRVEVEAWLHGFTRAVNWQDAVWFFLNTPPPSGNIESLRRTEAQTRNSLSRLMSTVVLGPDGLPRATAATDEERAHHEMSFAARIGAENLGRFLAEGLNRIPARYGLPPTGELAEVFLSFGCADPELAMSLAKAFHHFWAADYESCVHLIAPKTETAARNILRELDEGIYRVQAGRSPGGYPGLYVLLDDLQTLALDESWAFYLKWLLADPWGMNLRNDVAHGFVFQVSPTYAALVLRAASLLIAVSGPRAAAEDEDGLEGTVQRRLRAEVLELLADPTRQHGRGQRAVNAIAAKLELAATRLRVWSATSAARNILGSRQQDDR